MSLYMHCRVLILVILCGCFLSSCTPAPGRVQATPPTTTPQVSPPTSAAIAPITIDQLTQVEQQWNNQKLTNYRMNLQIETGFTMEQWKIIVQDGQVHTATCLSDRCNGYAERMRYTVAGFFDRARAALRGGDEVTTTFDSTYHFPQWIRIAIPHVGDGFVDYQITAFEADQ
jgi:hypothetical protein